MRYIKWNFIYSSTHRWYHCPRPCPRHWYQRVVVLLYSHEALLLVSGDAVGHLLSIGTNQVAPVLLDAMGGVDSLCHDASVEAIHLALVAGEDVLCVVCVILVQVGW